MPASLSANTARHILVVLVLGNALAACDTSPGPTLPSPARTTAVSASPEPAELAALRARPLRLPTVAAGDPCPVTQPAPLDPPPPAGHPLICCDGGPALALGHAPVFPDARYFRGDGAQVRLEVKQSDRGWYGTKAPWASRPGYRGWVLIRTARLDGPGRARVELQLDEPPGAKISGDAIGVNEEADWQFWPGGTEVTGAGCYAYQVDGSGFTEVIVFRAQLAA
jgi:hypothetical protein